MRKKFIIAAPLLLSLAACGQQKEIASNLVQVSEFSIVTPSLDTLYLNEGNEMSMSIKSSWDNGSFRQDELGAKATVLLVSEDSFNRLSDMSEKSQGLVERLSKLAKSH